VLLHGQTWLTLNKQIHLDISWRHLCILDTTSKTILSSNAGYPNDYVLTLFDCFYYFVLKLVIFLKIFIYVLCFLLIPKFDFYNVWATKNIIYLYIVYPGYIL